MIREIIKVGDLLIDDICGETVSKIVDLMYGGVRNVNLQKFFSKLSIVAIAVKISQNFGVNHSIHSFAASNVVNTKYRVKDPFTVTLRCFTQIINKPTKIKRR